MSDQELYLDSLIGLKNWMNEDEYESLTGYVSGLESQSVADRERIAELQAQLTEMKGSFDLAYKYIQETDNDLDFEVFKGEESQVAQEFSIVEDDGTEHFDTPEGIEHD